MLTTETIYTHWDSEKQTYTRLTNLDDINKLYNSKMYEYHVKLTRYNVEYSEIDFDDITIYTDKECMFGTESMRISFNNLFFDLEYTILKKHIERLS